MTPSSHPFHPSEHTSIAAAPSSQPEPAAVPVSAQKPEASVAHPPETLEGWYALHQVFAIDRSARTSSDGHFGGQSPRTQAARGASMASDRSDAGDAGDAGDASDTGQKGWSACAQLIGSRADLLAMHFRPTLEELSDADREFRRTPGICDMRLVYSFLSVTEAGLYHITAQLARDAAQRGGRVGDEAYLAQLRERVAAERESAHVRRRLYPELPAAMPYVCFYPMSKRRESGQNWYSLTLDERSRLMYAHGLTGRRYAGRVLQVITGAIGFDAWEWGVTLFAKDPLDFKKLVTEMRFDEVSAKYAEFGDFYVGKLLEPGGLRGVLETN